MSATIYMPRFPILVARNLLLYHFVQLKCRIASFHFVFGYMLNYLIPAECAYATLEE